MRCKYKSINIAKNKTKREHTIIVENAIGRSLRNKERAHHVDYNKGNNDNSNLVVCPSDAYHFLLHRRTDAYNATGDPKQIKCQYCGIFDSPKNIVVVGSKEYHRYHKTCKNNYQQKYRKACRSTL